MAKLEINSIRSLADDSRSFCSQLPSDLVGSLTSLIKKMSILKIAEDMDVMADEIIESQNLNELCLSKPEMILRSEGKDIKTIDFHDLKNISNKDTIWLMSWGSGVCNIHEMFDYEIDRKLYELYIILCIIHYIKYSDNLDRSLAYLCGILHPGRIITIRDHDYFKKGIKYIDPENGNKRKLKEYIASLIEDLW